MRWRLAALAPLAGAGTLLACSFILELPDPTVIGPDASRDAAGGDAADAGATATNPTFCGSRATPSLFCEDFDEATEPSLGSLGALKTKDGQLVVENAVSLSPRRALLTTVTGASSSASLTHTLDGTPQGVTLSFDLLVSAWQTTRAELAQIKLEDGSTTCVVRLVGDATNWSLLQECAADAGAASVPQATSRQIERGVWHRFALAVTFEPKRAVTFEIDGTGVVDTSPLTPMKASRTSVTVGIDLATSGTVVLFQDNVLVTGP